MNYFLYFYYDISISLCSLFVKNAFALRPLLGKQHHIVFADVCPFLGVNYSALKYRVVHDLLTRIKKGDILFSIINKINKMHISYNSHSWELWLFLRSEGGNKLWNLLLTIQRK